MEEQKELIELRHLCDKMMIAIQSIRQGIREVKKDYDRAGGMELDEKRDAPEVIKEGQEYPAIKDSGKDLIKRLEDDVDTLFQRIRKFCIDSENRIIRKTL
jgi:hypothetical protein